MLAYVGSGIRFISRSHAIGCINRHGELLLVDNIVWEGFED